MRFFLAALWLCLVVSPAAGQALSYSPQDGEVVSEGRPLVTVKLPKDAGHNYSSARMWVNGREVSASLLRTPMFVSYRPMGEMAAGPVDVRFTIPDARGRPVELAWAFELKPRGRIQEVTHNAVAELGEYEELVVEMRAEPGGQAWFEVEGFKHDLPMEEEELGVYRGRYLVKPGDMKMEGIVKAYLQLGPRVESVQAEKPVTIFGNIFRVKVYEPVSGSKVPLNFIIKGRTRPGAKVTAVANVGFDAAMQAPNTTTGDGGTGGMETRADDQGFFELEYGVPLKLPNMRVILSVFAVNQDGERSVPTILQYQF